MNLRLELFVSDLNASIGFYEQALGFRLERHEAGYSSLRRGNVVLGLGPIAKLPVRGGGAGFTQELLSRGRGAGVEIVLEVDDLDAEFERVTLADHRVVESVKARPWGLRDFRLADPDAYYLRVTSIA
jgi:catechol 2,3-dioxygenase-like lactoylglutathione lyase family enzyme